MSRTWRLMLVPLLVALALGLAPGALALADDGPLVVLDLATEGPAFDFGLWLIDRLGSEDLTVRWPDHDEAGELQGNPTCVVTWSNPARGGDWERRMREHLRRGGGMLYVVGEGTRNLRAARDFWSFMDVDIEAAGGESGYARWGVHPLTQGLPNIGAADPGAYISGTGASPLIRFGGQALAVAFDWGDLGRAVIIDGAILTSQLSASQPRPALRELLPRCVLWTAGGPLSVAVQPPAEETTPPVFTPGTGGVGALGADRVLVDIAGGDAGWSQVSDLVGQALASERLTAERPPGEASGLTDASLSGVGMAVIGAARDDFSWSEALALRRFFGSGGRLLLLVRDEPKPHPRMVAFNRLLGELGLAATLGRRAGKAELHPHPVTQRLGGPAALQALTPLAGPGAAIWDWRADPLVTVAGSVAAAALQTDDSRLVIMDAGLLLPARNNEPDTFIQLLDSSVQWLAGSD